jgi:hypothetical protein
MPFDVTRNPDGVGVLQPQKLYAYLASGLPVVSSDWKTLRALGTPARLCGTAGEFVAALEQAAATAPDKDGHRRYAARFDWGRQVQAMLDHLDALPGRQAAA